MSDAFITFRLFDKYDYQRLNLAEEWSEMDVLKVCVSFYMQTNGLCDLDDAKDHQSCLFNNYYRYLSSLISSGKLNYTNEDSVVPFEPGDVYSDCHTLLINKSQFLEYLEANNVLKLDIARLNRFLTWDEAPMMPNVTQAVGAMANSSQAIQNNSEEDVASIHKVKSLTPLYRFERTAQSWDIQHGDVILRGVKDYAGMQYIKQLLANPWTSIGVIEIQAMMNEASIKHPNNKKQYDTEDRAECVNDFETRTMRI